MPLPPNYTETLRLIKTFRSLPATGRASVGYTATEVAAQYNVLFPGAPLTVAQVATLLALGTRRGVFKLGGCSTGVTNTTTCASVVTPTAANNPDHQLYFVNTEMASYNYANVAYVAVGYIPDPTSVRTGYFPCSEFYCASGYGAASNPYARAPSGGLNSGGRAPGASGGVAGGGGSGNAGFASVGGVTPGPCGVLSCDVTASL
jgi:hypothetical protein